MPRYKIDITELCESYLNEIPVTELAQIYKCTPEVVYFRLKKSNNELVMKKLRNRSTMKVNAKMLIDCYKNGMSILEISKEYGRSTEQIESYIQTSGDWDIIKKHFKENIGYNSMDCDEQVYWDEKIEIILSCKDDFVTKINKLNALEK